MTRKTTSIEWPFLSLKDNVKNVKTSLERNSKTQGVKLSKKRPARSARPPSEQKCNEELNFV